MDRITPLPPATMTPTGPFKLSTHPGTGSLKEGVTASDKIKKIQKIIFSEITFYKAAAINADSDEVAWPSG